MAISERALPTRQGRAKRASPSVQPRRSPGRPPHARILELPAVTDDGLDLLHLRRYINAGDSQLQHDGQCGGWYAQFRFEFLREGGDQGRGALDDKDLRAERQFLALIWVLGEADRCKDGMPPC